MSRASLPRFTLLLVVCSLVVACGPRPSQWGVVLWAPDDAAYGTGAMLPIYETSRLRSTFTVRTDHEEETMFEVPQWRIRAFDRRSQAEEFSASYSRYADLFGINEAAVLNVRETTRQDARIVYKLRESEIVKVIGRATEEVQIGQHRDVWHEVLTDDGVSGYAFGVNLGVYTSAELRELLNAQETDEFLDRFLFTNFRPVYYRDMLRQRRVDLERFTADFGVFPDPQNNRLIIVTENHVAPIEYENIVRVGRNRYAFDGSTLRMTVHTESLVNLTYSHEGTLHTQDYVYLGMDIDMAIAAEQERRRALYQELYSRGARLVSAAYGEITLGRAGSFDWVGFERLVPGIVPPQAGNRGTVRFPLFLSDSVQRSYDGAMVFSFGEQQPVAEVPFVYRYDEGGLRVSYVPPGLINAKLIEEISSSPIVIFFSYDAPEEP